MRTKTSPTGDALRLGSNAEDGFTLLELLVVLAILATIAAAAVAPLTGAQVDKFRAQSAARTLVSDIRTARQRAITSGMPISVSFNSDKQSYFIGNALRRVPTQVSIHFTAQRSNSEDSKILFFPDGTSSGGKISIIGGKRSFSIVVTWPFGRVESDG